MPIKYNKNKIRLWKGVGKKTKIANIGIKFNKNSDARQIRKIYNMIKSLLDFKYGRGKLK